ncbi:MAG: peptidoglycan endopeptidase [Spirochaetes bacterium]|nr:peptidoglycan endopeptidase [Spirochaetota bacterium]
MKVALFLAFLTVSPFLALGVANPLAAFSDPGHLWGNGIERVIEEFFRENFRTKIIGGRVMNVRMPFAMNHERDMLSGTSWTQVGDGKASPQVLWPIIEDILATEDFQEFVRVLSSGREKVIIFDLATQTWSSTTDIFYVAGMRAGFYRGLPHRPHVLVSGRGILESDVYNYLYSIGRVGIDCSGFVWHALAHIGRQGGINLGNILRPYMGLASGVDPALFAGTAFFNSNNRQIMPVEDSIRNLRPADVMLFRGQNGDMAHAALIQSIDFERGIIRYIQSTDEAPQQERGVHDSFIYFDPANPDISLRDPSLVWSKQRFSPFVGERDSPFADDGERFRAFDDLGGSRVVRLRTLIPVIAAINSRAAAGF